MSTKFKIFRGDRVNLENEMNNWVKEKEPKGLSSIVSIHFAMTAGFEAMVLLQYDEWEMPVAKEGPFTAPAKHAEKI